MSKKRPPIQFNEERLQFQASNVADIYHQLALDLFDNVVERVTERGTVYLDKQPYIWQLEKMQQMHMLNEENLKLISHYSGVAEEQLRYIVENEGLKLYTDTKQQLMEDLGRGSAGNSNHIQEILADYASQAVGDIHNLINTTLPKAVIGAYQGIVEQSVARVVTGLSTADKAISDTVMEWQEKGFQGFKDSAGRNWKIDNYARTVIKTTTYRTYREMRTRPAEELGIDTFYFSKKASARKSCAPLQHEIVTTGRARVEHGEKILALSDYGYGRPEGCLGINCGHMLTPFIPGANYKPDLGEDVDSVSPEQAIENANAEAKQRALERSIRANKEKLHVAEKLGDKELIDKYKSKIGTQKSALKEHISQHPFLKRDEAREKYYDNPYEKAKKEIKLRKEIKQNTKIDFSKLTTKEINNLDFDDLMKYYEWVEEQEKLKAKQKELQVEAERKLLEERESKVPKTRRDLVSRIEERLRTTNFVDVFGEENAQGLLRELRFFPNDDFVNSVYGSVDKLSFAKVKEMSSHVSGTQINLAKGDFIYNKEFNQKAHSIVLHELTHGIDNVASYFGTPELGAKAFSSQYDLYNVIKKDMDNYIFGDMKLKRGASIDEKRNFFNLRQAKVRDFKSELLELAKKLNPEIRPEANAEVGAFASDMMSSFRSAEYGSQPFNHSDSYWKNKAHRGMEFIAEYTQAQMTPEIKSFYDKVFPNSVKIYNEIFEDISKLKLENKKPIVW